MKETPKDNRMYGFIVLYDMHTGYFNSVLDGISDTDAHKRLDTKANHIAWLAGSLVHQRFETAKQFGVNEQMAAHDLYKDFKGIQDGVTYPPLASFKADWEKISPLCRKALLEASTEKLDSMFDMGGGQQFPYYDLMSFNAYREANQIGQIALWRRLLGYPAMKYM